MTLRARLLLCLVMVAVVFGAVGFVLSRAIPDVRDRPLAPDDRGFAGVPIEPPLVSLPNGDRELRWPITPVGEWTWLDTADTIDIAVATFLTHPALRALELERADGRCRFAAAADAVLVNNATTTLGRVGPCSPADPNQAPSWTLTLRMGPEGRAAFWAYDVAMSDPVPAGLAISATRTHDRQHVLRGRVRMWHSANARTRAELLAYAWTGRTRAAWLWVGLCGLAGLLGAGLWGLTARAPWAVAVGAAGVALASASLWAVVVPPLQGADEPDHLLSYAEVTGRRDLEPNLRALAELTHFERIRFRGDERLRPMDVGVPNSVAWTGDIHAERMDRRSPLAIVIWRLTTALPGTSTAASAGLLIRLRLVDAAIFATVVGLVTLLLAWGGRSRWPLLGLAVVPTLPYFATAFSDWALVASGAVLLAGALVALLEERGPHWARGAILGLALSWLLAASMSTLALGPLVGAVLAARIGAGPDGDDSRATAAFWGALAVGLVPGLILTNDVWAAGYARFDQETGSGLTLLTVINAVLGTIAAHPWLLLLAPLAGAGTESSVQWMTRAPATALVRTMIGRSSAVAVLGMAALAVIVLAGSLVVTWPTLTPMELAPVTSVRAYVQETVWAFVTSWRLTGHDHLLFTSFWSGFGWIDAIVPTWLLTLLAAGSSLGWAVAAVEAARESPRRAWLLAAQTAGILAAVATVAVAGGMMERNVHGRYLIGVYTPLVLTAWSGWGRVFTGRAAAAGPWVTAAALTAIHVTALITVVARYF